MTDLCGADISSDSRALSGTCVRALGHAGQHRSKRAYERQQARKASQRATDPAWRDKEKQWQWKCFKPWFMFVNAIKTDIGCELCGFRSVRAGYFDIDHIDREAKTIHFSKLVRGLTFGNPGHMERFWLEMANCQVLCVACHRDKTRTDLSAGGPGRHANDL